MLKLANRNRETLREAKVPVTLLRIAAPNGACALNVRAHAQRLLPGLQHELG
jgi:hypothetical protein